MATPNICVLKAPGTNCDAETAFAFERAGGCASRLHLFRLLEEPQLLAKYQILCIPGGFSYGDDIGAGVVFGSQLRNHLREAVGEFLQADKLVLGICNGFQVLLKAGILPGSVEGSRGSDADDGAVTLTWNENGRYTARWVALKVDRPHNVFLRGIERVELPIAHAEGRVAVRDTKLIDEWRETGQLSLQYAASCGAMNQEEARESARCPANPNGSIAGIAGLSDRTGRILGMMPHPERFLDATQHPQWTRRRLRGDGDGLQIFRNAVDYFA